MALAESPQSMVSPTALRVRELIELGHTPSEAAMVLRRENWPAPRGRWHRDDVLALLAETADEHRSVAADRWTLAPLPAPSLAFVPPGHDELWRRHARCAGSNPEPFFPEPGQRGDEAKAICAQCPVVVDCLLASLDMSEDLVGIFGGAGGAVRRWLRLKERSHAGYDDECSCLFCSAVREHLERLDGAESSPLQVLQGGASHGKASSYSRGCRCPECRQAKTEFTRESLRRARLRQEERDTRPVPTIVERSDWEGADPSPRWS